MQSPGLERLASLAYTPLRPLEAPEKSWTGGPGPWRSLEAPGDCLNSPKGFLQAICFFQVMRNSGVEIRSHGPPRASQRKSLIPPISLLRTSQGLPGLCQPPKNVGRLRIAPASFSKSRPLSGPLRASQGLPKPLKASQTSPESGVPQKRGPIKNCSHRTFSVHK